MTLNKNAYIFLLMTISAVMLILTTSCDDKSVSPGINQEAYQLQISLSTGMGSRALEFVEGSENEDYMGDVTLALYYDGQFLMDIQDKITPLTEKNTYKASLEASDFETAFGNIDITFSIGLLKEDKFQILATANWESYRGEASIHQPLTDLWRNTTDYNFTNKKGASNKAWLPEMDKGEGVPMFGLSSRCKIAGNENYVDVSMLRALAKFEVFDVMKVPDASYPFSISGVTLSKSASNGRLIPNGAENPNWNNANIQVAKPSLPSEIVTVENLVLVKSTERLTYNEVEDTYDKWVCYIPEMDLNDDKFKETILDITLNGAQNHARVNLLKEINKITDNSYILRNGFYRFFVIAIRETDVDFEAIIDPDPYGNINFISIGENRWWIYSEPDDDKDIWYKLVYDPNTSSGGRSHWEKEWYFSEDGKWYKWIEGEWKVQDSSSEGPYEPTRVGVNSQDNFEEIITTFLNCDTYSELGEAAAALFVKYGKALEINGEIVKYFILNQDFTVPTIGNQNLLAMHRDYIWLGNGHTVTIKSYGTNGGYYNIGPVRDIYIVQPDGKNRLYIDLEGYIYIEKNGVFERPQENPDNKPTQLEKLEGIEKSYDVLINGLVNEKSSYFSNKIGEDSPC